MLLKLLLVALLVPVSFFVWGVLRLRRSQREAWASVASVTLEDVPRLCAEAEEAFAQRLGTPLDLDDYEAAGRLLSDNLDDRLRLTQAFDRPNFWWYFVLPAGAVLGELLRRHCRGEWKASEGGGVEMHLPVGDGTATVFPFEKVVKQVTGGGKGDLLAFLETARNLEQVVARDATAASP